MCVSPQFNDIFHFKDRMSFSFSATLDPDNRMPSGKTYAVSPISLVYRAYRSDQQYQAPIYPVVYSFTVPGRFSHPRVIKFKIILQPHQQYYITQYEELGFSSLNQLKVDYTTNSHYLTHYTFLFQRLGEFSF